MSGGAANVAGGSGQGGSIGSADSIGNSAKRRVNGGYAKKKKEYTENKDTKCTYCGRTTGELESLKGTTYKTAKGVTKVIKKLEMTPDHRAGWARLYSLGKKMGMDRDQLIDLHNDERNLMPACHGNGGCNSKRRDYNPMTFAREQGMSDSAASALNKSAESFRRLVSSGNWP